MGDILKRMAAAAGQQQGGPPTDATAYPGMTQGAQGTAQGGTGSLTGQLFGAGDGMNRFNAGGMTPNPVSSIIANLFKGNAARVGGDWARGQTPPAPAAPSAPPAAPGLPGPVPSRNTPWR